MTIALRLKQYLHVSIFLKKGQFIISASIEGIARASKFLIQCHSDKKMNG